MKRLLSVVFMFGLIVNGHASVLNTLDGTDYEWLELTDVNIKGKSRAQVDAWLAGLMIDSEYYGYQFASKAQTERLLLSYASFDGRNGFNTSTAAIAASEQFFLDFGYTLHSELLVPQQTQYDVDGNLLTHDGDTMSAFWYGSNNECGDINTQKVCYGTVQTLNLNGTGIAARQDARYGWDDSYPFQYTYSNSTSAFYISSLLVKVKPSSVFDASSLSLFAFGLLGLFGVARRKA